MSDYYSQYDEEKYIIDFFGNTAGSLLDIGAHDGITFSNSRKLIENGWKGTLVEPSPGPLNKLCELYHDNDDIQIYGVPIMADKKPKYTDPAKNIIQFFNTYGAGICSTEKDELDILWKDYKYRKFYTMCMNIHMLLGHSNSYNIDFITIDVEADNLEILRHLPWSKLKNLSLVCVEHGSRGTDRDQMVQILNSNGFINILYENYSNMVVSK